MNRISGSKFEKTIEVLPADTGVRLDNFLVSRLPSLSRNRIKGLIESNMVVLSSRVQVKCSHKLKGNEIINIEFPDPEPVNAIPEDIALKILYEDESILVLDKKAGMVVHPAAGHSSGTLVNAILSHCENLSGIGGKLRPGIVHRLDKDTSGVMIVTKNDHAHQSMSLQFKNHSIKRKYKALVYGRPEKRGTADLPLGRHKRDRKKISVVEGGRRAVTHWRVLKSYQGISLVELELETGRTHQIRVHLSNLGHPIVGDKTYGSKKRAAEIASKEVREKILSLKRQALHACLLGFNHPDAGSYMEFISPIPDDIQKIINSLEEAS